MSRRVLSLLIAVAVSAAACTGGDGSDADGPGPQILFRPSPIAGEGEAVPTRVPEGRVEDKYVLEIEMCFNTYELYSEQLDETQEFTTVVDCRRPHDGEVFATHFHQADAEAPFPGTTEMARWSNVACHGSFEDFVGTAYELSALEIGTIRPDLDTWTGEGVHREVICYLYAPGAQLSGPMFGSEF
jgi:hypothetical protein